LRCRIAIAGLHADQARRQLGEERQQTTTLPSPFTPWIWNTFFARSSPMVVILVMDGPLLLIRRQRSLYGT
jgi:hypothetical protein